MEEWLRTASPADALAMLKRMFRPALCALIAADNVHKQNVGSWPWPQTISPAHLYGFG